MNVYSSILAVLSKSKSFLQLMVKPNYQDIFLDLPILEIAFTKGFTEVSGLSVERTSFLPGMIEGLLRTSSKPKANMDELMGITGVLINDVKTLTPWLNKVGDGGTFTHPDSLIPFELPNESIIEIFKNYHTGLGKTTHLYYVFLRYAHNVHTVTYMMKNIKNIIPSAMKSRLDNIPDLKIKIMVEDMGMIDEVRSIPDITALLIGYNPKKMINGVEVSLFDPDRIPEIPITADSKFLSQNSLGNKKLIQQQMKQMVGRRTEIMLSSIEYLKSQGLSDTDAVTFFAEHIPDIFQHFVTLPKNFSPGSNANQKFIEAVEEQIPGFVLVLENLSIQNPNIHKILEDAMHLHLNNHFGASGNFLKHTDMNHPWIP